MNLYASFFQGSHAQMTFVASMLLAYPWPCHHIDFFFLTVPLNSWMSVKHRDFSFFD